MERCPPFYVAILGTVVLHIPTLANRSTLEFVS